MSLLKNIISKSDSTTDSHPLSPDTNTIYSFGSQSHQNYGQMIFNEGGQLYGYTNEKENAWDITGDELHLLDKYGNVSSTFKKFGEIWLGHAEGSKWPYYLLPLITLKAAAKSQDFSNNGFFINSIPKAGTYFLEDALNKSGVQSVRLHLTGYDVVDDFRELRDEEIHVNPGRVRINCPVHLVTSILKGRAAVGHVEVADSILKMHDQGVTVFNLRRNLRDVLVSLYRFKYRKVTPFGDFDLHWRAMSESSRFIAFLITYAQHEIAHIKAIAEMMLCDDQSINLTYEDMCVGHFNENIKGKLDAVQHGFADKLAAMLKAQYGVDNPTFSGNRSNWQQFWNEDVESFFNTSGLAQLNHRLGY